MLPSHKTPPRMRLSELTVLVHGPAKIGKCLGGDTTLIDPRSARPIAIRDFVAGENADVLTMRDAGVLAPQRPSAYLANEPAQLYRLTTQTGRTIEATANHPFLTREGWKPLSELGSSDRVAVVAEYPSLFGQTRTDDALLKILAYLIADGSLCDGSAIFTKKDPEVRMDFEAAVEAKGDECIEFVNAEGITHVRVRGKQGSANNVVAFLKEVGLSGLRSAEKFIPEFIFGLEKGKLSLFLNRLFTCDGSVESSGRISYSSTSVRMVRQVQHLLLRFGIVSCVRDRLREGALYGAELLIASKANVLRYLDVVGFVGEKAAKAEAVRAALYNVRESETQLDRVGPVLFDRVTLIEPTEVAPVFDLTMDGTHNFVAGDFIVHNSTLCSRTPDALFLATEAGLNALEVFQVPIGSWADFLNACKEIAEGKHGFKTIVIDTLDNLFLMCQEHVCARHKIEHPADLGYGKGFSLVNGEFYRVLNKLSLLPYGLFLISHSQEKDIETRTGKRTRIVPALPEKARQAVLGMVDVILFCDVETHVDAEGKNLVERRVMRTKPTDAYEAGDRTGRLPDVIELEYVSFAEAFERATPAAVSDAPASAPVTEAPTVPAGSSTAPVIEPRNETPAAAPAADKDLATEDQVKEFRTVAAALGIPSEVMAARLAQFGASEPERLSRSDMDAILGRLRAASRLKPAAATA